MTAYSMYLDTVEHLTDYTPYNRQQADRALQALLSVGHNASAIVYRLALEGC